jgi:hypothetical protein
VHPQPPVFAGTDAISVTGEVTIPVAGVVIEFRKKFGGQAATVGDAFAILLNPVREVASCSHVNRLS